MATPPKAVALRAEALAALQKLSDTRAIPKSTSLPNLKAAGGSPVRVSPSHRSSPSNSPPSPTSPTSPKLPQITARISPPKVHSLHTRLVTERSRRVNELLGSRNKQQRGNKPQRRRSVAQKPVDRSSDSIGRAFCLTRDAASAFFEADVSGDQRLDMEEFLSLVVPDDLKLSDAELKAIFDSVDTDGSGDISMDEFCNNSFAGTQTLLAL